MRTPRRQRVDKLGFALTNAFRQIALCGAPIEDHHAGGIAPEALREPVRSSESLNGASYSLSA